MGDADVLDLAAEPKPCLLGHAPGGEVAGSCDGDHFVKSKRSRPLDCRQGSFSRQSFAVAIWLDHPGQLHHWLPFDRGALQAAATHERSAWSIEERPGTESVLVPVVVAGPIITHLGRLKSHPL